MANVSLININKIYPIYTDGANGKIELDYAHYWNVALGSGSPVLQPNEFFLFGDAYAGNDKLGNDFLLGNENYMKAVANKTYYENTAGYITTDETATAAVRIVRGGYELRELYDDKYEILVMQAPQLTDDEVYTSMFAIGAYTVNEKACAEILNFINTDSEVRNILQYGILNENYTLEETTDGYKYAKPTEDNLYVIDSTRVDRTGNAFIAHAPSAAAARVLGYQKLQNRDVEISSVLGMTFDPLYTLDVEKALVIEAVSAAMQEYMASMTTYEEGMAVYAKASALTKDRETGLPTPAAIAVFIRDCIAGNIYYEMDGQQVLIRDNVLRNALRAMQDEVLYVEDDPETATVETNGIYAFYLDWCTRTGR